MRPYNKQNGQKAEDYFHDLCNKNGISCKFVDNWYDFDVEQTRVEVKSCRLTIKHDPYKSKHLKWRVGRFDFGSHERIQQLIDDDVWVCFLVRHYDEFLLLGFLRGRDIPIKRYMSIHSTRNHRLYRFKEWREKI